MLLTCRTCQHNNECKKQTHIKQAVKGLGITSYKIRCIEKLEIYQAGQPVEFRTVVGYAKNQYGDGDCIWKYFPAVIIKKAPQGFKYNLYCKDGSKSICGDWVFEAKNGTGFCNIPISRIRERDGTLLNLCKGCDYIEGIREHDDWCHIEGMLSDKKH